MATLELIPENEDWEFSKKNLKFRSAFQNFEKNEYYNCKWLYVKRKLSLFSGNSSHPQIVTFLLEQKGRDYNVVTVTDPIWLYSNTLLR